MAEIEPDNKLIGAKGTGVRPDLGDDLVNVGKKQKKRPV